MAGRSPRRHARIIGTNVSTYGGEAVSEEPEDIEFEDPEAGGSGARRRPSRRAVLAGTAGAAAAMWATPAVATLSRASAGVPASAPCIKAVVYDCNSPAQGCGVGNYGPCVCATSNDGTSMCIDASYCGGKPMCANDADCGPGWGCFSNTCCSAELQPICMPVCGTFLGQ